MRGPVAPQETHWSKEQATKVTTLIPGAPAQGPGHMQPGAELAHALVARGQVGALDKANAPAHGQVQGPAL